MKPIKYFFMCVIFLALAANARAQEQDVEGCKDSPIITRMQGSVITSCEKKEFSGADLEMGNGAQKHVEGEYYEWKYTPREGVSPAQVFHNFDTALRRGGFTIDFEDPEYGSTYITAHKGNIWVGLSVGTGSDYEQIIVIQKQMQQEIVANAAALSKDLKGTGHTAVYGIHFDTGKADIKPESAAALKEIAKLLQQNPGLKIYVVGHTDNVGSLASNMDLSLRRARAVVKALTAQYGVAAGRLQAFGTGPYAPVASNDTDQGRALNRRVELVKQ